MRFFWLLAGICVACVSCSSRYYMKRGKLMTETGRMYKGATRYEKAYNKTKHPEGQAVAAMLAGQCYQDVNRLSDAYNWYRKARRADKNMPEVYLKMGEVCMSRGDLDGAVENYNLFNELFPDDERGKNGLYYIQLLQKEMSVSGRYSVGIQKEFNSRYSDFAPMFYPGDNNLLYFTSTRKRNQKKRSKADPVTGEGYSHIYVTEYTQEIKKKDKRGNVRVRRFPESRWLSPALIPDSLLSARNDGAVCFSSDGNTLYFTSSRLVKGNISGTRIYKANKLAGEGENKGWMKLSSSGICGDSVSVGHPAITPDGNRMYFATDRLPGGVGGKDIWYVDLENGKWGEPQNAGELINTEGDEMYPYVRDNGELYFASNGHSGFGGLDLYKVADQEGEQHLEHLPAPLNSFADDFGITFRTGKDEGFFTSSRSNRSDNIYYFAYIPQVLRVQLLAKNKITDEPVRRVNVTVVGDDGNTVYLETDSMGMAFMEVAPSHEYIFTAEHERFLKGKGEVSTYREKGDRVYKLTIDMQPIEKPIVIPNIYFDVAKWDLREDAMKNLGELLTILKDNPNITIELSAHTDMVGNDQANMILSDRRANSVVNYLITQGVYWDRLVAKGYGESRPRQINEKDAQLYDFLKVGDVLTEGFVRRLKGTQREIAMQLNRRIEFKVLSTNYKPGPNSLHNPNQVAQSAEETTKLGETRLKDIKSIKGKFYTLQLGVFKTVPAVIYNFRVVFTEKMKEGVRYCTGAYEKRADAEKAASALKQKGIECFIQEYNH